MNPRPYPARDQLPIEHVISASTLRVLNYCYRWGVGVVFETPPTCPPISYRGLFTINSRGLFTIIDGVIFRDPLSSFNSSEEPLDLLHELSHVLDASPPADADELTGPMLAFEYYSSRWLKLTGRREWMRDFSLDNRSAISNAYEWGQACQADKHGYIQQSLKRAVRRKLLTVDGKPTFHRVRRR